MSKKIEWIDGRNAKHVEKPDRKSMIADCVRRVRESRELAFSSSGDTMIVAVPTDDGFDAVVEVFDMKVRRYAIVSSN